MSSISDSDVLSPKESLLSSPKVVINSINTFVFDEPPPGESSDTPDIGSVHNEEIGDKMSEIDKISLSRTETVPLKTKSSSSTSLQSDSSTSEDGSIEDIPFAKKSSPKSSISNTPSEVSNSSKVTVESTKDVTLPEEIVPSPSNDGISSEVSPKNSTSTPINILDILDAVNIEETKNSPKNKARDNFFAPLKEPVMPASIPPLSPSLKLSTKKVETDIFAKSSDNATEPHEKIAEEVRPLDDEVIASDPKSENGNDRPDTAAQSHGSVHIDNNNTIDTPAEFKDPIDTKTDNLSQLKSKVTIEVTTDTSHKGI